MTPAHTAFILLITICWGINAIPVKLALEIATPITVTVLRFLALLTVCLPFVRWHAGQMRLVILFGLLSGGLSFGLMHIAYHMAHNISGLAIASQAGVPFSLLLAIAFLGERIHWRRGLGVALALIGIVILTLDPRAADDLPAIGLIVISAFVASIGTILVRQMRDIPPLSLQGWLALTSLPPLLILAALVEPTGLRPVLDTPWPLLGFVVWNALLSSVVGHAGYSWLLQRYPINVVAPWTLITPVISVTAAIIILGNPVTLQLVIGSLVTLAGIAVITIRSAQRAVGRLPSKAAGAEREP